MDLIPWINLIDFKNKVLNGNFSVSISNPIETEAENIFNRLNARPDQMIL